MITKRIIPWLPAVAIAGALTVWAVFDGSDAHDAGYQGRRGTLVLEAADAIRDFMDEAQGSFRVHYERHYPAIVQRHQDRQLKGDALQRAVQADPEMVELRGIDAGLTLVSKLADHLGTELMGWGQKLLRAQSREQEEKIWSEGSFVWSRLAPQARSIGQFNDRFRELGLGPLESAARLERATRALSSVHQGR